MSAPYGTRIDVGHEIKPGIVLYSICEYGCMRTDGFYCPHLQEYSSFEYYRPCFSMYHQRCSCAAKHYPDDFICYATQTTERYIQDHHVISLNEKEVRIMDLKTVKEARRTADGNCVAIDDIIDVRCSYINNGETRKLLHNNNAFTGRLKYFGERSILFDVSTQYESCIVDIPYTDIVSMKVSEEKRDVNCD